MHCQADLERDSLNLSHGLRLQNYLLLTSLNNSLTIIFHVDIINYCCRKAKINREKAVCNNQRTKSKFHELTLPKNASKRVRLCFTRGKGNLPISCVGTQNPTNGRILLVKNPSNTCQFMHALCCRSRFLPSEFVVFCFSCQQNQAQQPADNKNKCKETVKKSGKN